MTPSQTAHEPNAAPWYKRRFVYDRPDHGPAGSRPKTLAHEVRRRRNRAITLGVSLTVALTAAVTSWGFGDDLARTREQALDRMKDLAVVQPVSAESGSSTKGHDAKKTLDDNPDTWWQPRGKSKVLTYKFGEATRLVGIVIRPAKSAVSPMKIQVKAYGGEAYSEPTLKQNWEWDGKTIAKVLIMQASDVARVSLEVLETDGVPPENVAISEVEFATRKSEATPSPTG